MYKYDQYDQAIVDARVDEFRDQVARRIAGEITEADKVLLPAIESCINTQALKAFRHNLPVVRSTLDHRSAIGAFALVKRAMLNGTLLQRLLES